MKHWRPRGKVLKYSVLTTTALIAMRLFYVQDLVTLFLIFAVVHAFVVALLIAGVLLNHVIQIAFGWTKKQRSAFIWRLRRSSEHTDKLPVGLPGSIEKEVEARIRREEPTSFFVHSYLTSCEQVTTSGMVKELNNDSNE